jgi:hypothetical protein
MSNTPYFDAYERTRASRNRTRVNQLSEPNISFDSPSVVAYPYGSANTTYTGIIDNVRVSTPARISLTQQQREYRLNKRYTEFSGAYGPVRVLADATLEFRDTADGPWERVSS